MLKLLNFFNGRTLLAIVISQLSVYLAIRYHIRFNLNLTLFGLAIGFPLAFSIQSAFKRRERALEYFSLFKGSSLAVWNSFRVSEDLVDEKKDEAKNIVQGVVSQLMLQLRSLEGDYTPLQRKIDAILAFIDRNREDLSNRNVLRIIRYIEDVSESSAYLVSLVSHRTMIGLRFYAILFILIFPTLQAPIILYRMGDVASTQAIYILMAFTSLAMVTLSNFQTLIEHPFNPKGIDNIRVEDFKLDLFETGK